MVGEYLTGSVFLIDCTSILAWESAKTSIQSHNMTLKESLLLQVLAASTPHSPSCKSAQLIPAPAPEPKIDRATMDQEQQGNSYRKLVRFVQPAE